MTKWSFARFASTQLASVPEVDGFKVDLSEKTVVVVGANAGLGFEASKHLARMNPHKLILACRNQERAEGALAKIKEETGYQGAEIQIVDLANFDSVKKFSDKITNEEQRLDILVENAGILPSANFTLTEDGWEPGLQINHLSTSLLGLLLLPKLIRTAEEFNIQTRMIVVSSEVHMVSQFDKELWEGENPLQTLNRRVLDIQQCVVRQTLPNILSTPSLHRAVEKRYCDTKLLNLLFIRALNERIAKTIPVVVACVNPGFCYSELRKPEHFATGLSSWINWAREKVFARTAEEGSRQLVYAAVGGRDQAKEPNNEDVTAMEAPSVDDLRGAYISDMTIAEPSDYVVSTEGHNVQQSFWVDLIKELAAVEPMVQDIVNQYLTEPVNMDSQEELAQG
ncbi:NAD(P)-binding protein [Coprinopsis marcescibilis]|uniref:NAD(P)-binding protein n=1 Tax=Coprinopsis marcescibilis TaxID=230819 RepID=A0A5C3KY57_COPMA|nr:NAD(P)-binding protein [Coprinopsis marcescibilis]